MMRLSYALVQNPLENLGQIIMGSQNTHGHSLKPWKKK
jgi:hypothetical protein